MPFASCILPRASCPLALLPLFPLIFTPVSDLVHTHVYQM
jgi:hypothetical protein